jgi:arylsulfatase A-like enzyme
MGRGLLTVMARLVAIGVLSSLLLGAICSLQDSQTTKAPRLVVLYAVCSLNKDYLQPYTKSILYTPNIKSFAEQSVVFQRHQASSSFSGAAYASLFSGSRAYRHRIYYHPAPLSDDTFMIAEAFQENGYDTVYLNGHSYASASLNFAQGIAPENLIEWDPALSDTVQRADEKWDSILKEVSSRKRNVFVQVNLKMTHAPYTANSSIRMTSAFCRKFPEECRGISNYDLEQYGTMYAMNHVQFQYSFKKTVQSLKLQPAQVQKLVKVVETIYKSSVQRLDAAFGRTLLRVRKAGLLEECLFVFTSDHGEVMYRSNSPIAWTHSCSYDCLEEEAFSVPLIVRLPGRLARGNYSKVTRVIDVFPTIAGLSNIKIAAHASLDGIDLSRVVLGKQKAPNLIAYSRSELPHPVIDNPDPTRLAVQARVQDTIYKLIPDFDGAAQLQVFNLLGQRQSYNPNIESRKIEKELREYRNLMITNYQRPTRQLDWDEIRRSLKANGYLN